ncbi:hypothetical protein GWI33_006721 [Rhynchophorus ferrugineus]|uniref:Uncharacterized protein n=1 Tax=Rhynchophorus ferrugineus TaxID=354439 RepID=A0A834IEH1_RHYFE|nr:hypothetical protein GWI33_006721 [Rhynchophorus ferrugineus]
MELLIGLKVKRASDRNLAVLKPQIVADTKPNWISAKLTFLSQTAVGKKSVVLKMASTCWPPCASKLSPNRVCHGTPHSIGSLDIAKDYKAVNGVTTKNKCQAINRHWKH